MIREDPRNPNLLYLGCELGLFVSIDRGGHWVQLKNNLPTLAFNDLLVHPRDNDLVLGTHGRGIWILDNVNALQELTPRVLAGEPAHLFTLEPAEMIRYVGVKAQGGDLVFKGKNPPAGAIVDYYLREEAPGNQVSLTVLDEQGKEVQTLEHPRTRGVHRVVWDLRYPKLPDPVGEEPNDFGEKPKGPKGPWVVPGRYTVRLTVGGQSWDQPVAVRDDPRIEAAPEARRSWTATLLDLAAMYRESNSATAALLERKEGAERSVKLMRELRRRIVNLYEEVSDWTGEPTEDQKAQARYLTETRRKLEPEPR